MKKGQTEIVGLIFIVLFVIIIGSVFLLVFLKSGDDTFSRSEIKTSILANKFLATLIETEIEECSRKSIKSIIKDFYEGDTQCLVPPYDTSVNSKEYLEDNVFPIILTKIFSDKGRAYNFSITYVKGGVEEPPFYSSQGNFDKQYSTIRKAAPFIIPMDNPQNKIIFNLITKTN